MGPTLPQRTLSRAALGPGSGELCLVLSAAGITRSRDIESEKAVEAVEKEGRVRKISPADI